MTCVDIFSAMASWYWARIVKDDYCREPQRMLRLVDLHIRVWCDMGLSAVRFNGRRSKE